MNEVVIVADGEQLSVEEAVAIDAELVAGISSIRYQLTTMYTGMGWASLGFNSWEDYLKDLGDRTGSGSKYLRRINNAGLLESGTGYDLGTFKEGVLRPINETLSDSKGFNESSRADALELAIELAGSIEEVTGNIAQSAACYVVVETKTPEEGYRLIERMKNGQISPRSASEICQVIRSTRALGIEHILAEITNPRLAHTMANLYSNSPYGETWTDLVDTIERSGTIPTWAGAQVPIANARNDDFIEYLNEPNRLQRQEKTVEQGKLLRDIANAAAIVMIDYFGLSINGLPEDLSVSTSTEDERNLYYLLQQGGFIRIGRK